ncbi:kelch-like protein 15 [Oculina patagonica]
MVSFNPYTNNWMALPCKEERDFKQIFVANEDEMYALVSEPCEYHGLRPGMCNPLDTEIEFCEKEKHVSFITKYKPESNSWEDVSSFDHMNLRRDVCIVAKDYFIYFIGGVERRRTGYYYLRDVDRYDLRKNQWDKVADIEIARSSATGAAANGKIFIAGGTNLMGSLPEAWRCEVFIEATNEWQFTSKLGLYPWSTPQLLSVDNRLYVLAKVANIFWVSRPVSYQREIKCYDPDKNEWSQNN